MGGQGGCERRIEVFVKIQNKNVFFLGGGSGRVGDRGSVESGWGGGVNVNVEVKLFFFVFFLIFTKYSTHHSLSAYTGFKSLAFILFEILHLQNYDVKFQNFQRAITKKNHDFFLNFTR